MDVGCGTGRFLGTVTNAGVDFSPKMVEIARRKGLPVALADATNLPFDDASFDHVVIMHLLMHVPDVGSVLREASRVVKDGGSVVFDIPNKTRWRLTRFTPGGWHAHTVGGIRSSARCRACVNSTATQVGGFSGVGWWRRLCPTSWTKPRMV